MRHLIARIFLSLTALCWAPWATAQDLTATQLTQLRAAIFATPEAAALLSAGNSVGLRVYLSTQASPDYTLWKSSLPMEEVMGNGMDWARVDNLSVGKARIWDWMGRLGTLNCAKANIRAGIDATWVGTAADLAVRAVVYTHCKRLASNAEKLLSTGLGTVASPSVASFEGSIGETDGSRLVFKDNGTIWTP